MINVNQLNNKRLRSLKRIIVPLVTPLINNELLDIDGLDRLIEHVINGGVHGIFILGTTGEAQSMSFDLRMEMIRQSARIVEKRVPLLVMGICDDFVAVPFNRFGRESRTKIEQVLTELNL